MNHAEHIGPPVVLTDRGLMAQGWERDFGPLS